MQGRRGPVAARKQKERRIAAGGHRIMNPWKDAPDDFRKHIEVPRPHGHGIPLKDLQVAKRDYSPLHRDYHDFEAAAPVRLYGSAS